MDAQQITAQLQQLADSDIAKQSSRFFKTSPGAYSEHEQFIGIKVPALRQICKSLSAVELSEVLTLLTSQYHEAKLLAVFILVKQYQQQKDSTAKQTIVDFYIQHASKMNNWDLVDSGAHKILGPALLNQNCQILYDFAHSACLWQRRIAMMTTWYFIKHGNFDHTMALANILINDQHDLIHKVVGWMLREVAKQDSQLVIDFIIQHYDYMPRTMLRYAIEKFPQQQRKNILAGEFH